MAWHQHGVAEAGSPLMVLEQASRGNRLWHSFLRDMRPQSSWSRVLSGWITVLGSSSLGNEPRGSIPCEACSTTIHGPVWSRSPCYTMMSHHSTNWTFKPRTISMCWPYDVTPSRQIAYLNLNYDNGTRSTTSPLHRQHANLLSKQDKQCNFNYAR